MREEEKGSESCGWRSAAAPPPRSEKSQSALLCLASPAFSARAKTDLCIPIGREAVFFVRATTESRPAASPACCAALSLSRSLGHLLPSLGLAPSDRRQTGSLLSCAPHGRWPHDVRSPVIPTRLFRPTARAPSSRSACGRPTGGQCLGGPSDRRGLIRPRGLLCRHSLMCIRLCTFLGRQHGWTGEQ